jgi:ATP-binding cassette, subfamily B, bacterial PglK
MKEPLKQTFAFMTKSERSKWALLTTLRALLSILDLAGVMAVGFVVTSIALFLTRGSDPNRVLEFAGFELLAVNAKTLPYAAALIVGLFLTKSVFSIIIARRAAFFVAKVEARSAKSLAQKIFSSDLDAARSKSAEEIMFAIQVGSPSAFNGLLNSLSTMISESVLFLLICFGFFLVNPPATFAAILYFGLVALVIQLIVGKRITRTSQRSVRGSLKANVYVSDLISVFRELSVLGLRQKYIDRLYQARVEAADGVATQAYLRGMPRYIIEAALLLGISGLGVFQALSGDIVDSAATLGVFLAGGFRLTGALLPLQSAFLEIRATIPRAQKAFDILGTTDKNNFESLNSETDNASAKEFSPLGVQVTNLSYCYPTASSNALEAVTLEIKPGEQVALIGASGAGKSTLADLIAGVLSPTVGKLELQLDGNAVARSDLAGAISYVPQRPGLVAGTIAENIALAVDSEAIDKEQVWRSLEKSHLSAVIKDLPEGIDTDLGNMKDRLSGGQLQRIGLARALYTNPGLLIMDEATSALDAESEAEIAAALNQIRSQVTVVLIAHRLNTIQHSDQVFLIDDGKLMDSGTFKELQKRNPSVARVVELMRVEEN